MWTLEIAVIVGMIAFNSVFAGYEIALASIGEGRLHALVQQRKRGAAAALRMKQNIEGSLGVVQLGITLCGAVAAATGGAGAEESIAPALREWGFSATAAQFLSIALVVAPLTVFTIILGELAPKVFALRNKEWVCLALSPAMEWFAFSVRPAVWVLERSVEVVMHIGSGGRGAGGEGGEGDTTIRELQGAAALARVSRLIGHREEGIILSASRLATTPVRRIMLPSEFVDMLVADSTLTDALIAAHQSMHTRYPVTEEAGNPQRIIGYANFKDIVATLRLAPRDPSFRNLVRRMPYFDADKSVADCLEHLMRNHNHIGLVRERDGRVVGMVTLEDIIEELVGEIHDEFDRLPAHVTAAGPGWIVGGFVSLAHLRSTTGIELGPLSEKPLYTVNDWIVERLGHPPRAGDTVETDTCTIQVRKTRNVLVQEAYLSPGDPVEVAAAERS